MIDLSTKTVLVWDLSGSYVYVAERLAQDFGSVLYHSQWQGGFSQVKDFCPGIGLENIERIADPFDKLDRVDMVIFTDVGLGDLQEFLRREAYPVFGSGAAQVLEIDRALLKQTIKTAEMASANAELVTGVDALTKLLRKAKDKYVKFSFFRGDMETYHHKKWFSTETWLHNLAVQLGPYGAIAEFLVEDPIEGDACEVGLDTFAVNGILPSGMLWGYEVKDSCYLGTTDPLPQRLEKHAEQIEPILRAYKYRGILSTEIRVTESDLYLIDFTARCPSPPSEVECCLMENFSEVVYEGAHGHLVEPEYRKTYGAELILRSDWIVEHPLALEIGDKDRVMIHGHFKIEGKDYAVVPEEFSEFGAACGIGNSVEDAVGEALEAAESVTGHQVKYDADGFSKAIECVKDGQALGIDWFNKAKALDGGKNEAPTRANDTFFKPDLSDG